MALACLRFCSARIFSRCESVSLSDILTGTPSPRSTAVTSFREPSTAIDIGDDTDRSVCIGREAEAATRKAKDDLGLVTDEGW